MWVARWTTWPFGEDKNSQQTTTNNKKQQSTTNKKHKRHMTTNHKHHFLEFIHIDTPVNKDYQSDSGVWNISHLPPEKARFLVISSLLLAMNDLRDGFCILFLFTPGEIDPIWQSPYFSDGFLFKKKKHTHTTRWWKHVPQNNFGELFGS